MHRGRWKRYLDGIIDQILQDSFGLLYGSQYVRRGRMQVVYPLNRVLIADHNPFRRNRDYVRELCKVALNLNSDRPVAKTMRYV